MVEELAVAAGHSELLAEGDRARWHLEEYPGGGQYYAAHGKEWEPEAEAATRAADAILLGAIGWPGATRR